MTGMVGAKFFGLSLGSALDHGDIFSLGLNSFDTFWAVNGFNTYRTNWANLVGARGVSSWDGCVAERK